MIASTSTIKPWLPANPPSNLGRFEQCAPPQDRRASILLPYEWATTKCLCALWLDFSLKGEPQKLILQVHPGNLTWNWAFSPTAKTPDWVSLFGNAPRPNWQISQFRRPLIEAINHGMVHPTTVKVIMPAFVIRIADLSDQARKMYIHELI